MTIVYVVLIILKKSIEDACLGIFDFFDLIAGFAVKGVGFYLMNQNVEKPSNAAFELFFRSFGKYVLLIAFFSPISKTCVDMIYFIWINYIFISILFIKYYLLVRNYYCYLIIMNEI